MVEAIPENAYTGEYPLARFLYVYMNYQARLAARPAAPRVHPLHLQQAGAAGRGEGRLLSPSPPTSPASTLKKVGILHTAMDEYRVLGFTFLSDGALRLYRLDTGEALAEQRPLGVRVPTASSFAIRDGDVAFGFEDGSVQYGKLGFTARFLDSAALPAGLADMERGDIRTLGEGVVERTPDGQFRQQILSLVLEEPVVIEAGMAIRHVDVSMKAAGNVVAALSDSGALHVNEIISRRNLMTGKVTVRAIGGRQQLDPALVGGVKWLGLSGLGDNVFLVLRDGTVQRYDTRDVRNLSLSEAVDLVPEAGAELTVANFLIGKTSLVVGDTLGRVHVWSRIKPDGADTADGETLVLMHAFEGAGSPVRALAASARTRMLAAGYADGRVDVFHVTSGRRLGSLQMEDPVDAAVRAVALGPKDDGLLAVSGGRLGLWDLNIPHPEVTFAALFRPVWYEGYTSPEHVWQSSSGTDDFESKYGVYPLVFGTIKATAYAMLFGVPLALLAAIYTSEMMSPRLKAQVKPTIEMMASLPSVVLGFLAALVVAPFVEGIVPEVLACLVAIPFVILLGAYLWQLLPVHVSVRLQRYRLLFMLASLPLGVWLGFALGPHVEATLFAGDLKAWLTGRVGAATGGWLLALLPLCALAAAVFSSSVVNPIVRTRTRTWSRAAVARLDLAKFLLLCLATLTMAYALSGLLAVLGDLRGGVLSTYVQRNALVVGFAMGFAIIPIIYTISEDALSAVPEHLRAGSLGAGATPWQTTFRIIVPTAMSGLFSALMVGLGRAVGETMIVLMAAGNTPVLEWNIFNGFRTLSANIAVELPEAVRDSTHYRILFLAALTLFAMTFVVNTIAELIRQRFRKRAYQL
jgi:phosphate transport system permease protein